MFALRSDYASIIVTDRTSSSSESPSLSPPFASVFTMFDAELEFLLWRDV